ncbi:MAG TPA: hypothetical protein VD866_22205 [Urbifossiella sp.]|nr:hypothetical protein [Urbifossiella sp.]
MFPELERAIEAVMAEWDTPATRALCLDCWVFAQANGEAEGVALCRLLLAGVADYKAYLVRINAPIHGGQPERAAA